MIDNDTKVLIIERLHKAVAVCMTCHRPNCSHGGNTTLPDFISTDVVLKAINCDEHFFKEEVPK